MRKTDALTAQTGAGLGAKLGRRLIGDNLRCPVVVLCRVCHRIGDAIAAFARYLGYFWESVRVHGYETRGTGC
ncbi:MAG: hypothetical protein ACFCBU_18605 [Cyanophyceae cyanobacterium]